MATMKPELQKMEPTLRQQTTQSLSKDKQLPLKSGSRTDSAKSQSLTTHQPIPSDRSVESVSLPQKQARKTPALPKIKSPRFTSHRNGINPYLAMNLLKEMETVVARWQSELRQILRQIQDIYLEGPIIEGWLESESAQTPIAAPTVERSQKGRGRVSHSPSQNRNAGRYRLVNRNADGKLLSRPCPPEEVPSVSLAIARYQKLQHLLARKQELETHLTELAEVLTVVQGHIQTL
ncbi:hypothetical protein H6S82_13540 [Planktothrix sp. FACHB-1355]|uniref:Uncharacterized protein n=1 Tax=Aerosakkonema funiforme FACHB-1375 TaxID=2949571 RepID=A0A926VK67_9CYAN|nr:MULTISPECIES: hypothetical protein [Oscillatoriales]MBD2185381.1 hypothetical protein [Aerosakkonema funiforme FACHB-1375]MBD3559877.1 hypothetical protein [Planktothrix sp. FACHB-1355]